MNRFLKFVAVMPAATLMLASLSAHAALGGDVASVMADQSAFGASVQFTTNDGYTDYALSLPKGGEVHEFVNASGRVFEVTWLTRGYRPNMNQLLGDYSKRFSGQYSGGSPTSRHADRMDGDFELHSKALHGYFSGTAHIPTFIPLNLSGPLMLPTEQFRK